MQGGVRHPVLADQQLLGRARTLPRYALLDLGAYPGLVHQPGEGRSIQGEVYEIAESLIKRLDRIEGAPNLFRLEPVLIDDHPGEVFAYFYQQRTEGFSPIKDGCWRNEDSRYDT
jgi:gamma-glutamylcyclotransferase (GGCT)/AIG2-like uncharacterized protein YtfP